MLTLSGNAPDTPKSMLYNLLDTSQFGFLKLHLCVCTRVQTQMPMNFITYKEARRQPIGVCFQLPSCGFWRLNFGHRAWWQHLYLLASSWLSQLGFYCSDETP